VSLLYRETYDTTIRVYQSFVTIYGHILDNYETGNSIPYFTVAFKHPAQMTRAVKYVENRKGFAIHIRVGTDVDTFVEEFINICMKRLLPNPPIYEVDEEYRANWVNFLKEHLHEIAK